ncbi:ketopantoate reductase family protein [Heliophilum fasciatum]|uniref:2-dehydropantoate 2-reductase n=1 Tax=Heliophilum fasciatum TaxID=35700 RepID=A0A4R2RR89_9FIRM|nr:ketopantoate reductase family protein [Heliophilum fasciatum]MCW2277608.1 2-dehydropantoate 2-reductase [Heliophilum fasciatum]TCP64957.1 ketopantoate reductase [Heliophilum fasciatum]
MRILVFGLGALGTVYACLLKKAGHHVIGLGRPDLATILESEPLTVHGIWGQHLAHLDQVITDLDQLTPGESALDLVIVAVKSHATAAVAAALAPIVGPQTLVLLTQNGYGNYETALQSLPAHQLIASRVIFGAEVTHPATSQVTVMADDVIIGSPHNLIDPARLEAIASACRQAGIPTRVSADVMQYIWGKIIYNSVLNSLGAILEVTYGELAADPDSRALLITMVREIFAVMDAMNARTLWPDADAYLDDFFTKMVPSTKAHYPSMLQDLQRQRRTEIDALTGAMVRLGQAHHVSTPVLETITLLVKAKEALALSS